MPRPQVSPPRSARAGLRGWLTSVDPKRIGILYGATGLFFLLVGGVEALVIRAQLMGPRAELLGAATYAGLFTMHGTTMVLLGVMPLSLGFASFLLPLMIGSRDVAFPRLNAFGYWLFLASGIHLNLWLGAAIVGGDVAAQMPNAGWTGYASLAAERLPSGRAVDLWLGGLHLLGVAFSAAGLCFVATILTRRAPGMTLPRMPVFVWLILVGQLLSVLAFSLLSLGLGLVALDRALGTSLSPGVAGALERHRLWLFGHPALYVLVLPAMGIVSEVVSSFSRRPLAAASVVVLSGVAIGLAGFGVWGLHMAGPLSDASVARATLLTAIPAALVLASWLATLARGRLRLESPMLFALGFVVLFLGSGASGLLQAWPPDARPGAPSGGASYAVVAHLHYALFGGSVMGLFAGIYYWWPKMFGRMLDEGLGRIHFWLWFVASNLTFFPMHALGAGGMARRSFAFAPEQGFTEWNLLASLASYVLGGSVLVFVYNVYRSARRGARAPADPWDGATLEWAVASPPPAHGFDRLPRVTSARTYWDEKYATREAERDAVHWLPGEPPARRPRPSGWPLAAAAGIFACWLGLLLPEAARGPVAGLGAVVFLGALAGWLRAPLD